jgi:glutathione S-transferase
MRAVFRYRRLPHIFQMRNGAVGDEVAHVRPSIIPLVRGADDTQWMVDSTPIIYELEARHADDRSVLPDNRADRFLAELIEDFADEWLTKAMVHYRWFYASDRGFSSYWIATDQVVGPNASHATRQAFADQITDRQVGRMAIVGCTEANKPVIERSYERVLDALEPQVGYGQFLFGSRPSIGDFGLFGQLKTLSDDPTPQWLMRHRAPTVCHWIRQMDDLSGLTGEWRQGSEPASPAVLDLLGICGDTYLPFLSANERAINSDEGEVTLDIRSQTFSQPAFRYQAKCYSRLKGLYKGLEAAEKARIDDVLDQTGCLKWLG